MDYAELPRSPVALGDEVRRVERERGIKVIRLDVAEPLFDPPTEAIEGSIEALRKGLTRYSPPRGLPELVEAVSRFLKSIRGLDYDPEEILITPGAKFAIFLAMKAILRPGDEVVVISPFWTSFYAIPTMLGAKVVEVDMRKPFGLDEEKLKSVVSRKTRIIVVNNPHNPTGWVFTREELELVRDLAIDYGIHVISDEVDWAYTYDAPFESIARLPGMHERAIVIDSFSKVFAMTGWRVGMAAGPKELVERMLFIQQHTVSAAPTFAQWGCLKVLHRLLEDPSYYIKSVLEVCKWNRDYVTQKLSEVNGVECPKPPGAFYVFPSIERLGIDSETLARKALEYGVAIAPGTLFGERYRHFFRLCYAAPKELVVEGVNRLKQCIEDTASSKQRS